MKKKIFTSLILLAGGTGSRLKGSIPKQFRPLLGKPVVLYSFDLFASMAEIDEIVVVCAPKYQNLFPHIDKPLSFALPGERRQDSVYNGLLKASDAADLVCVHDAARPFIEKDSVAALLEEAIRTGAAALAIPAVNTIKQVDSEQRVRFTLPRQELWELQTPQAIRRELFLKAFAHAREWNIDATDDLSLVEAIGEAAVLVKSSPRNFKITTPYDWDIAEKICASN
jgi:2-C-methyl-D-erythritol 4-phosphate cytidylyltransferase